MRTRTIKVYIVLYHDEKNHYGGSMGDGSFTYRTRDKRLAEQFAVGRYYYGKPAKVMCDEVPQRIAERWGMC